jgi:hypothetical protein
MSKRLIYYPTGSYGTFLQWLCNTKSISSDKDLPFDVDGNSHKYTLSDEFTLLIHPEQENLFFSSNSNTVASCQWPTEHNGRKFNIENHPLFYLKVSVDHLRSLTKHQLQIVCVHPTDTSKIWHYHNNFKKVYFDQTMFEKKIKPWYPEIAWLTHSDPIYRARLHISYYKGRDWYNTLLQHYRSQDIFQVSLGQLRSIMATAIANESGDFTTHWTKLYNIFPNIKFIPLDSLRDNTKQTIEDIFSLFKIESSLPLDFVVDQWQSKQTTAHRDTQHAMVIDCVIKNQFLNWENYCFDFFDEAYMLYELKSKHNITLNAENSDCLPTNTQDLLRLAH